MKLKPNLFFLVLFSISIYGQNSPIKFEIDSVKVDKTDSKKQVFSIFYKVTNLTNQPLSFFLFPNTMIANAASSMTLFPVYRIFQNDVITELDGPFYEKYPDEAQYDNSIEGKQLSKEKINELIEKLSRRLNSVLENYKKNGGTSTDTTWIVRNQRLWDSKIVLQSKEVKQLVIKTFWNKKRYFNQDNIEYYLNENDKYEIELTFDLKRDLWKNTLSETELKTIQNEKSYIQGIFKTNKFLIDFKD